MFEANAPPGAAGVLQGLAVWGGVECTVNRVGDCYFTQLDRSGHEHREDDLARCAAMGLQAMRYPVLWERAMRHCNDAAHWQWTDRRLHELRRLGVGVIAGLLHHGSGPEGTSLKDPDMATKFARYAAIVAQRYPWIDSYTPVNEPLTTARFSGLYGLWYPHGRDPRTFKDVLLNQCRAIVLGMREIRRINPVARLVQTDDLGQTYSTPAMAYQAQFNNTLRWLAWDLLFGCVDRTHPLWDWLLKACDASVHELMWFADNPCPPDLIGVNHYITSDRFFGREVGALPCALSWGQRRSGLCRHRSRTLPVAVGPRPSCAAAGGVGTLRHTPGHHRGSHGRHARRPVALVSRRLEGLCGREKPRC